MLFLVPLWKTRGVSSVPRSVTPKLRSPPAVPATHGAADLSIGNFCAKSTLVANFLHLSNLCEALGAPAAAESSPGAS